MPPPGNPESAYRSRRETMKLTARHSDLKTVNSSLGGKYRLRNHHVNAIVLIYQLCNVEVSGNTRQHVSIVTTQVLLFHKEIDHFTQCNLRRFDQVGIHAHGDVMRRCFGTRPTEAHVFTDNKLKSTEEGGFHSGNIHPSIPLAGMSVANLE